MSIPVSRINIMTIVIQSASVIFFIFINVFQYFYPSRTILPEIIIGLIVLVLSIFITSLGLQRELFYIEPSKFDLKTSENGDSFYVFSVKPYLQGKPELLLKKVKLIISLKEPNLELKSVSMGAKSLELIRTSNDIDGDLVTVISDVTLNSAFNLVLVPTQENSLSELHALIIKIYYRKNLFHYMGPSIEFVETLRKSENS